MKKISLIILLPIIQIIHAQQPIRVELKNEFRTHKAEYDYLPIYIIPEGGEVSYIENKVIEGKLNAQEKIYKIHGLNNLSGDLAFTFEYFTGWENAAIPRNTLIVVENYKSNAPTVYIDYNHNMNISDDGPPHKFKGHNGLKANNAENFYVDLYRPENKKAEYTLKITHHLEEIQGIDPKFLAIVGQHPYLKNNQLTDKAFWFGSRRQNTRSASLEINGQPVQLGVIDWDCNGLYNDPADRVLIGEYKSELLSFMEKDGAVEIGGESLIMVNGQVYEVTFVESTGEYLELVSSDKKMNSTLKEGDIIPDLEFKLINGETSSIHQYLEKGKYTLVDVWGTWCKPCVASIPKQKEFYNQYKSKVNVIGLAAYDKLSSVQEMVKEKDIPWPNGMATNGIVHTLMVEGYPYYVLLDDSGKIIRLGTHKTEEVYQMISNR